MQTQDFLREYETKTDDELLRLAIDPSQLTYEANFALSTELLKRRLNPEDIQRLKEREEIQKKKDERNVGQLWVIHNFGLGKRRFGKADYKYYESRKLEEFTTTIFFLIFWFPLIPLGTYRIMRKKSFFSTRFGVIEKLPLNWPQVLKVWAVALLAILALVLVFNRIR